MRSMIAVLFTLLLVAAPASAQSQRTTAAATFAGGCFWCTESDFDHVEGVISTTSGYAGGTTRSPTYRNHEGHLEVVRVVYDPARVSYRQLVDRFWRSVDPTDDGGQFCDRGGSYRTAVFYGGPEERAQAEASRAAAQTALGRPIVTRLLPAARFTPAEAYHQNFATANPMRYRVYRQGCGRDSRLRALWGGR